MYVMRDETTFIYTKKKRITERTRHSFSMEETRTKIKNKTRWWLSKIRKLNNVRMRLRIYSVYESGGPYFMQVPRPEGKENDRDFVDLSTRLFSDLPAIFNFFLRGYIDIWSKKLNILTWCAWKKHCHELTT